MDTQKWEDWELSAKHYGRKTTGNIRSPLYHPLWDVWEYLLKWNAIKKSIPLIKGARALDIGTGTGRYAIKLAKKGFVVSACDISETLLNIAKTDSRKENVSIDFQHSSVEDLTYPANTFDLVLSVNVLQHIIDLNKFTKSIKKVAELAEPSGVILIIENARETLEDSFEERYKNASLMICRTKDEWIKTFEKEGLYLIGEQAVQFERLGYLRLKKSYLFRKKRVCFFNVSEKLSYSEEFIIFLVSLCINVLLAKMLKFKIYSDVKLLLFKKGQQASEMYV